MEKVEENYGKTLSNILSVNDNIINFLTTKQDKTTEYNIAMTNYNKWLSEWEQERSC